MLSWPCTVAVAGTDHIVPCTLLSIKVMASTATKVHRVCRTWAFPLGGKGAEGPISCCCCVVPRSCCFRGKLHTKETSQALEWLHCRVDLEDVAYCSEISGAEMGTNLSFHMTGGRGHFDIHMYHGFVYGSDDECGSSVFTLVREAKRKTTKGTKDFVYT